MTDVWRKIASPATGHMMQRLISYEILAVRQSPVAICRCRYYLSLMTVGELVVLTSASSVVWLKSNLTKIMVAVTRVMEVGVQPTYVKLD